MNNGIIVKFENDAKIDKVCKAANGKARKRLADCTDVVLAADTLTEKFKGINKEGLKIEVNVHAQSFARCYKGVPMATTFVLLFKAGTWHLLSANRVPCRATHFRVLHMDDATKASILRTFETFYGGKNYEKI